MSTVLLVDDDSDNRWALQLALEGNGHQVVLAKNGADALKKLLREIPRLIITDWQMPEMDGAELCRHVRCNPALAHLPIVMLSAMPGPGDGPPCWSAFFRKPADLTILMRTVEALTAERLTASAATLEAGSAMASRWQAVNPRCWP
ncbi:response regulator [Paraburkholderia sp. MM5482-R1]|uniref:response regulator n=1 Tax=unclassified Paraburkholderia TaxID=2615204 RepID=UPI003D1F09CD